VVYSSCPGPAAGSAGEPKTIQSLVLITLAALIFGAGKLGLSMARLHASVSPVWPATGIALARRSFGGAASGRRSLRGLSGERNHPRDRRVLGANLLPAAGIAIGTRSKRLPEPGFVDGCRGTPGPGPGFGNFPLRFPGGRMSTAISATIGTFVLSVAAARPGRVRLVWLTWWMGDMVGAFVIAPLILIWASKPWPLLAPVQWLEVAALGLGLVLVSQVVFGLLFFPSHHYPLGFSPDPLLVWAALRLKCGA